MTVLSEESKITYIGSSSQTLYPIPFEFIKNDDIKVSVYDSNDEFLEDWTYSTQYVIQDNNVKVLEGYEIDNTKKMLVKRTVDYIQDNKYREGGDFPAKSTETSFDKTTMMVQQLQEEVNRCPKVNQIYNINVSLPAPNAGKALIWNAEENGFKNSTVDVDVLEEVTKQYRDESEAARDRAITAETNAKASELAAKESEDNAKASELNAAESANTALEAATKASFGNIGDIKYTSRTDVPNGGAWCDGSLYTKAQFPDLYQMLVDGKIQSTTVTDFDSKVSANGSCGFFGLDTSNERFKVPLLKDVYLKAGQAPSAFGAESLPNITGAVKGTNRTDTGETTNGFKDFTGAFYNSGNLTSKVCETAGSYPTNGLAFSASLSSSTYQDGAKVNPEHVVYRAYVVLYSSAAEASVAQAAEFINAVTDVRSEFKPDTIKKIGYEKYRHFKANGNLAVYLQNTDEVIDILVESNSNIIFDVSNVNIPAESFYTIQVKLYSPQSLTISLQVTGLAEGAPVVWVNGNVADLSDGKAHWIVLRTHSDKGYALWSDAGTEG